MNQDVGNIPLKKKAVKLESGQTVILVEGSSARARVVPRSDSVWLAAFRTTTVWFSEELAIKAAESMLDSLPAESPPLAPTQAGRYTDGQAAMKTVEGGERTLLVDVSEHELRFYIEGLGNCARVVYAADTDVWLTQCPGFHSTTWFSKESALKNAQVKLECIRREDAIRPGSL